MSYLLNTPDSRIENPRVGGSIPSPGTIFSYLVFKIRDLLGTCRARL